MKIFNLGLRHFASVVVFAAASLGVAGVLSTSQPATSVSAPAGYEEASIKTITCQVGLAPSPDASSNGLVQTSSDAVGLVAVLPDNTIEIIPQVGDHLYQVPEHLRGPDTMLQVQGCSNIVAISLPTAVPTATAVPTQNPPTGSGERGTCDLWLAEVDDAQEEGLIQAHPDAAGVVAVLPDGSEQEIPLLRDNIYQVPEDLRTADVRFKVINCEKLHTAEQLGLLD